MGAPGARIRRPESGKNKMRITVSIAAPAAGGARTVDAGARASTFTAGGESERADSGKRGKRVSTPGRSGRNNGGVWSRPAASGRPAEQIPPAYSRPDENGRSLYGHSG